MPKTRSKKSTIPAVQITHAQTPHAHLFLIFHTFILSTLLSLGFVLASLLLVVSILGYRYLHTVSLHAGIPLFTLVTTFQSGWQTTVPQVNGRENFLILGVDTLGNRDSVDINTDTIMVASLNLHTAQITTFSLPRDLYLVDKKTKINGIYNLALKNHDAHPELQTKRVVETLINVPIQHTVVLELNELGKLIDAVGGIDVTVEHSFTDSQFPREDVDVTREHDPAKLYKTITFQAGTEHMNGARALEFIRSRHSTDPLEGGDDARVMRQQHVVASFFARVSNVNIVRNPAYVGELLRLYTQDFAAYFPLPDAIATAKTILLTKQKPFFQSEHFSIQGVEAHPVFYHPTWFVTGQWVYLLTDPSGKQLQSVVSGWLP